MTTRPVRTRAIGPRDILADDFELPHSDYLNPHHILMAWASASARYWRRRAATFEAARPHLGDYQGQATAPELAARWDRLSAIAQACRNHADLYERYGPTDADLALIFGVASEQPDNPTAVALALAAAA